MDAYGMITALEQAWDKQLDPKQRKIYAGKLSRFSVSQLESIFEAALERCKYFPKLADLFDIAEDLGSRPSMKPKKVPKSGCPDCRGSGWQIVSSTNAITGEPYEGAKRCECTGTPHPKASGGGPTGQAYMLDGRTPQGGITPETKTEVVKGDEEVPF